MRTAKIEVVETVIIPDGKCVDASGLVNGTIETLQPKIKQLYLGRNDRITLKPEALQNLTHLYLHNACGLSIPETLEHLFIHHQKTGTWPTVHNLYIELQDVQEFLIHQKPERFHVFQVRFVAPEISCLENIEMYDVSDVQTMRAFGRKIPYRTLTLKKQDKPTTSEPAPRLSHSELIELNRANAPDYLKKLSRKIYETFHQACLKGRGWETQHIVKDIPKDITISFALKYLQRELPGFTVVCDKDYDEIVITM